ncbi:MAG: hypothetical protein SPL08_05630, partial [Pseudomonadota bacterium]|nr:hypothetical protein [Pseudomonadota bacterium]
ETTSLVWRLFHEKEIDIPHMKQILKGVNPQTHRHFLFAPKTRMDSELFSYMCGVFSNSPFYFWQWVRSFQAMSDFPKALAGIYPELPESVRNNKHYLAAMNNHYGLIRECALAGDTGTLSALKKILGKDIFWASLTQSSDGKVSGIRSLCKQGKRGLLKLMADFPLSRQQELFMEANSDGRTLLDDCGGSLARLVSQVVFQQVYQKEADPISPVSTPVVPSEKPQSTPVANRPMRQIIRIPVFDSHMARIANNSKLVKEVEEAMQTLAKMSKAEIFAEMRGGLRHHGSLDKAPCVVKGIRGNNYRLGYLLQGDIDQGTGQIAFLFFLTHAQYNIFLNKQADQAIRVAKAIMATPTGPTGPLGGRDGR